MLHAARKYNLIEKETLMALTSEWEKRIDNWRRELPCHFYRKLGEIDVSGFVTKDHLSLDRALAGPFSSMPRGAQWGAKWEYGWFRGDATIPAEGSGRRIVLRLDLGGECVVFLNSRLAGAIDNQHREVTLSMSATAGERFEIVAECYAGHGSDVWTTGPVPPGRITIPEPPETQAEVLECSFGIWEEDVYQLWLDVETLRDVRNSIDPELLRVAEIDRALMDFTLIVDFELPFERMMESIIDCRTRLKPLLDSVNSATSPIMFSFGHAHIDVAWLWPIAETERKSARTWANQLANLDEYPDYTFLQSQPQLYQWLMERYPELYSRVADAVGEGRFIADGAMWVEADTNIPSGESLIRQFLYGKRFFKEKFGVESEFLWLPDVFGYSGALPQIMRGCGVKYFATAKIFWAYHKGDPFPFNTFTWEGIDGSKVLAHLFRSYDKPSNPSEIISTWRARVQKNDISTLMLPFGFGDGGGGPTRSHIEFALRQRNLECVPKVRFSTPMDFFKDLEDRCGIPDAKYVGELYFQGHRGTYTSQAKTKLLNRKCEFALREAEMWSSFAMAMKSFEIPCEKFAEIWRTVLTNQFHDILPGSSIHRVYEESEAAGKHALKVAEGIASDAAKALTDSKKGWSVFNSLGWDRTVLVKVDGNFREVEVPSCGFAPIDGNNEASENSISVSTHHLENSLVRIELNDIGEVTSFIDKESNREMLSGISNVLKVYKDIPAAWDAWDIDSVYPFSPVELIEPATVKVVADGPLFGSIEVTRKIGESVMTQEISLRRKSRRVDFRTVVDWRESHKLLRVEFSPEIYANEALHEIQFGYIARPNHRSRQFDFDRFEVVNHKWTALVEGRRGFAILNDCKYGVTVNGKTISLALLKSALAPDMTSGQGSAGIHILNACLECSFCRIGSGSRSLRAELPAVSGPGTIDKGSLMSVDKSNIVHRKTVKYAEDEKRELIVRLYESMKTSTKCTLKTSLPVSFKAAISDMFGKSPGFNTNRGRQDHETGFSSF